MGSGYYNATVAKQGGADEKAHRQKGGPEMEPHNYSRIMGQEVPRILNWEWIRKICVQKPKDEPTVDFKPLDKKQLNSKQIVQTQDYESKTKMPWGKEYTIVIEYEF